MDIGNETDDRSVVPRVPLDDSNFLLHIPKFTALTSLDRELFGSWDFVSVIRVMPPAMRG
jgi:hypothetical protein